MSRRYSQKEIAFIIAHGYEDKIKLAKMVSQKFGKRRTPKAIAAIRRKYGIYICPEYCKRSNTLCWECARAAAGRGERCSWAERFLPVDGWEAEPNFLTEIDGNKEKYRVKSYRVKKCPLFVSDMRDGELCRI